YSLLVMRGHDLLQRTHMAGTFVLDCLKDIGWVKSRHIESLPRHLEDSAALIDLDGAMRLSRIGGEGRPPAGFLGILEERGITLKDFKCHLGEPGMHGRQLLLESIKVI